MTEISSHNPSPQEREAFVNLSGSSASGRGVNSSDEGTTDTPGHVNPAVNPGVNPGSSVTIKADPGIDTQEMARFIGMVFGKTDRPIEICAFTEDSKSPRPIFLTLGSTAVLDDGTEFTVSAQTIAEAVAEADREGILPANKSDITRRPVNAWYIRMTTLGQVGPFMMGGRGGANNTGQVIGFWLDGDYGTKGHATPREGDLPNPQNADQVREIWKAAGYPAPSVEWMTGGGLNGLWLFPGPITVPDGPDGEELHQRLAKASDRWNLRVVRVARKMKLKYGNVGNLDRLMRLPGSVNRKSDHHLEPKAVYAEYTGATYELDELLALIPEATVREDGSTYDPLTGDELAAARPQRPTGARERSEGMTSWDAYNEHMWANGLFRAQLTQDAWTHAGWAGRIEGLTRPEKDPRQGQSATFGYNEDPGQPKLFVFSDGAPGLLGMPKEEGGFLRQFLSPYVYLAATRYNGDLSACARDLYAKGYGDPFDTAPQEDEAVDLFAGQIDDDGQVNFGPGPAPVDIVDRGATAEGDPVQAAPEPIPLTAPDALPYDMERFGRLGDIAQAFADGIGVSPDMTVIGMLSAASTACGGKVYVYVDERDWKQPVVFHGINLAPPGGMKSDAGKICWKPVMELQKERRDSSRTQAEMDEMYLDICDSRIEKLKKDAVRVTNPGDRQQIEADLALEVRRRTELEDKRTSPCRLWANDTTPEALVENMARQGGRMAILDTEPRFLKIMAGGAGKKGGNPDPSIMLAGYDQDAGSRDRITNRTEVILEKPSLTIGIFTQPKRFASIAADNVEMDEGGAWGRFFYSVPTGTRYRSRDIARVSDAMSAEHNARIRAMFRELYDSREDVVVSLSTEAEEFFLAHWLGQDPELLPQEQRVRIDGWDQKEEGRALRIATLIELYENPKSREIGIDRIKDVIAISETMRTHARAASEYIATMEGDPLAPAREIHEWLREEMPKGVVTATAVLRALRRKRSKTVARIDHVLDGLRVLEDYNWIRAALLDEKGHGDLRTFMPHPTLRSPAENTQVRTVTNAPEAAGDPVGGSTPTEEPVQKRGKAEILAKIVQDAVAGHCDAAAGDPPGEEDWRVRADELYEMVCSAGGLTSIDGMSPQEKDAVPEDERVDRTRFGAALRAAYPRIGTKRTGKGAGKILWYTSIRFKSDRP